MKLECPKTHRVFYARPLETYRDSDGAVFVQAKCKICDVAGRVRGEKGFDKHNMQVHVLRVK